MKRWIGWMMAAVFGAWALLVAARYRAFAVEDSIHATYCPVVLAIERYGDDHGHAPTDLNQLGPDYLPVLPTSRHVSEVRYSGSQTENAWRLTLVSTSTGCRRLYLAEHGMPLSGAEESRRIKRYHGIWSVLRP